MKYNIKAFNRVLIVDDDYASVYLSRVVLQDMNICQQVITACNGQDAIQKIKQYCLNEHVAKEDCPDLILLDIHMPIMNGFDVLTNLQQIGQSNHFQAKVVVLTVSSHPKDMEDMKAFGVNHYFEKPITEDKILSLLNVTSKLLHHKF